MPKKLGTSQNPGPRYKIRCIDCGYECEKFNGWAFMDRICLNPGKPGMLHHWVIVKETLDMGN